MGRDIHNNQENLQRRYDEGKADSALRQSGAPSEPRVLAARSCYGVTLAGGTLQIVRAWRGSAGRVRYTGVAPADTASWQQWLADHGRPGNVVIGCVAVQESLTMWLQAPFASIPKAEKVLPSLLDVQLPFPLESCNYRFVDIRKMPDGTTHALAVVARRENIRTRLEAYHAQGLDPVMLDHEGLALWTRSLEEYPLPADVCRVILHLDLDHVALVIGKGDHYRNAHNVQVNFPALASGADSRAALEGLIGRLQRITRAELQAEVKVQWVACGSGALQSALVSSLHQSLAAEWPGPLMIHPEPETFLARALGARALTRGALRCNLRINELIHPLLLRQIRRQAVTTVALFLGAGLLLCGLNLAWHLLTAQRAAAIKRSISTLASELAPNARIPYGQEVREVQKVAAQRMERETPFLEVFAPSLAVRLSEIMREGKTLGVAYETLLLQRNSFLLTGISDDWDRCERLAVRLKALGYAVKLERQEATAETQVRFSVKGEKSVR